MTLNQLHRSTRQRISQYVVPEHEKGRTGSRYKGDYGIDMLCKHISLGKAIKAISDKTIVEESPSSEEEVRHSKRKRKRGNSGGGNGGGGNGGGGGGGNNNANGGGGGNNVGGGGGCSSNNGGGPLKSPCFLCGVRGHRSTTCKVTRD